MTHPKDTPPTTQTIRVRVEDVVVPPNRRRLRGVAELAASMAEVGQIHPITIRPDRALVAGLNRLDAARSLGWEDIAATVITVDDLRAKLIEIDENLQRNEGTHLERGEMLTERKRVYEALHPQTKRGVAGAAASNAKQGKGDATAESAVASPFSFARATAEKTGRSERAIRQEVQIAERISPTVKDQIRNVPIADNKAELIELARLPPESQAAVAPVLAHGVIKTVGAARSAIARARGNVDFREALNLVDGLPQDQLDNIAREAARFDEPGRVGQELAQIGVSVGKAGIKLAALADDTIERYLHEQKIRDQLGRTLSQLREMVQRYECLLEGAGEIRRIK